MNALVRHAIDSATALVASHRDLAPLAIGAGIVLATMAVSFWSLARAAMWQRAAKHGAQASEERVQATLNELRERISSLGAELEQTRVAAASGYTVARPGMNLSKRSQVLRLHRRGESPEQIATSIAVPRQEVELLLKVHRIVMARVGG
jgi:hypothetical protein